MEFRRRHNCVYKELGAFASCEPIGFCTADGIEIGNWIGIADREVVRQLPSVRPVLLDIESWRRHLLEPYQRLGPGGYMVGICLGDSSSVLGVMDRKQPMLRRKPGKDILGRK